MQVPVITRREIPGKRFYCAFTKRIDGINEIRYRYNLPADEATLVVESGRFGAEYGAGGIR